MFCEKQIHLYGIKAAAAWRPIDIASAGFSWSQCNKNCQWQPDKKYSKLCGTARGVEIPQSFSLVVAPTCWESVFVPVLLRAKGDESPYAAMAMVPFTDTYPSLKYN